MIHKAVAGQSWQRDIIGNNRTYSEHIPNIVRTYPGMFGHARIVVCRIVRRRITCGQARRVPMARRRTRCQGWSSRTVSPVAGSRVVRPVAGSRLVTSRFTSATSRLCGGHGRVRRRPVVCPSPAQQRL